jgi:hypothetical protein
LELRAHRRAYAVGADQEVAAHARAVGKYGGDAGGILLDALQMLAEPIAASRQRVAQRAIEAAPGAHRARGRPLRDRAAIAIEHDQFADKDAG